MKDRSHILFHPGFLIALCLLVINDHFLKAAYPSYLTGKLSDFAGLIVFSVFMAVLFQGLLSSKKRQIIHLVLIGVAFVVWKIAPVEIFLDWLSREMSVPVPTRVKDPADLMALVVLPFSYQVLRSDLTRKVAIGRGLIIHRIAMSLLFVVAGGAIMATSLPLKPEYHCCIGIRGNVDGSPIGEGSGPGSGAIDINDITYLASYLYRGGPAPPCITAADINGSGDKNPIRGDDLEYFAEFLFNGGPEPPRCP